MCKDYFSQICIENCSRMNKYLFYSVSTEKKVKIRSPMKETTIQGQQQSFGTIYRFDNSQDVIQDHGTTLIHQDHNHKIFNYNQNP